MKTSGMLVAYLLFLAPVIAEAGDKVHNIPFRSWLNTSKYQGKDLRGLEGKPVFLEFFQTW